MNRAFSWLASAIGWAALAYFHLYGIRSIPGLHFDEAWAYNFSWKIASQPGYWPLTAMSPYTSPWAHYWAALWLRLLGPSLAVFRGSQIALSLCGLAALALALPRHVRHFFPWACLLLPGLLLNHRFSVELNGLHVLCFGIFCLAARERRFGLACALALIGTTSHILFYAVPLGLLAATQIETAADQASIPKKARLWASVYFGAMSLFFLHVALAVPERNKAVGLVLSAVIAVGISNLRGQGRLWRLGFVRPLLGLAALLFFFNATFFAQGIWSATIYAGYDLWSELGWMRLLNFFLQWGALLFVAVYALLSAAPLRRTWFLGSLTLLGLMMLKPAPRYFELAMLGLAALLTLSAPELWASVFPLRLRTAGETLKRSFAVLLLLFLVLNLRGSLLLVAYGSVTGTEDRPLHFLFFKDSSRDFLDKQDLVRFLGSSGCGRSDIQTHDPRLKEELDALALGDWPVTVATKCGFSSVARRGEEGATGKPYGEFLVRPLPE